MDNYIRKINKKKGKEKKGKEKEGKDGNLFVNYLVVPVSMSQKSL